MSSSITATGQSPNSKFNAQDLLSKLRATGTSAASTSTYVLSSTNNRASSAAQVQASQQSAVVAPTSIDTASVQLPSDQKFELRAQLEKDIQQLTSEVARLKAENKALRTDKNDIINQMKGI